MTDMVIVPREATEKGIAAGAEILAEKFGVVGPYGAPEIAKDVFHAMIADAPASGKVTKEQVEEMAEAMWQDESMRASGRFRLIDWSEESDKEKDKWRSFARAALASIGLEVE